MAVILNTVLPVFGLIVLGYIIAHFKVMDAAASRGLGSFVFNIAIPALLFKTVATMSPDQGAPWNLWAAFFGGLALTWIATTVLARSSPILAVSGGSTAAMAACFGNLALLGTPLALAHFGPQVVVPLGMILSIHAPLLWTAATLHRELARNRETLSFGALTKDLILSLARNNIIVALLAATLWRYTGLGLTPVIDKMLTMLADASVPTALFALGMSLAGYSLRGAWGATILLIALKMLLAPALVFVLARYVFTLPPLWMSVAILFAAMPSGANAFLFAQKNKEAEAPVSAAITLGTALAAITISLLLWAMDKGWV